MTFRMFVGDQLGRLSQFREFAMLPEDGRREIIAWVAKQSGEKLDKRDRTALDWLSTSEPARRVKALCDELADFEQLTEPLQTIRAVWRRLNPDEKAQALEQRSAARKDCERCDGTGFVIVEGPDGLSVAYPCSHQPESEADRRKGVGISPAMAKRYIAEQEEARKRRIAFLQRRADGKAPGFHRVDQSDVDALMAQTEEM
jgi:hypothetical protein